MGDVGKLVPGSGIHPVYLGMSVFELFAALQGWTLVRSFDGEASFEVSFSNGTTEISVSYYQPDEQCRTPTIMCITSEDCTLGTGVLCKEIDIKTLEGVISQELSVIEEYDIYDVKIIEAENGGLRVRQEGDFISEISVYDTEA